jgi:hypothetical protein
MANVPNFLDVNRKKIDFFSYSNVIRSKGNIVAGPGPVIPFPSPTPTPPITPTVTPTPSITPTPSVTPFQNMIVGDGNTEQVFVDVAPGFENATFSFNSSLTSFEPHSLAINYNGQTACNVNYTNIKENQPFAFYPGVGNISFSGTFRNNFIYYFNS